MSQTVRLTLADIIVRGDRNPQQFGVKIVFVILGAHSPLLDTHDVELGWNEFAHFAGGNNLGKEEADHFAHTMCCCRDGNPRRRGRYLERFRAATD